VRGTLGEHVRPSRASPGLVSWGSRRCSTWADRTRSLAPATPWPAATFDHILRNNHWQTSQ